VSSSALAIGTRDDKLEETSTPLPAAVADRKALPRTSRLVDKALTSVQLSAIVSRVMKHALSETIFGF